MAELLLVSSHVLGSSVSGPRILGAPWWKHGGQAVPEQMKPLVGDHQDPRPKIGGVGPESNFSLG